MNKSPDRQANPSFRDSFNLAYLLVSSHAVCLTPFLHHGFGSEAFGLECIGAMVIMLIYGSEARCDAMAIFMAIWLAAVLLQRVWSAYLFRRGWRSHSRYGGYPWLAMNFPWVKTEMQALRIEPIFCLAAGALLWTVSPAMGRFVMAGVVSLSIKHGIERQIVEKRLRRMHDAMIEQEYLEERFEETWRK